MSTRPPDVVIVDSDLDALRALVAPLRKEFELYLTVSANDALAALARFPIRVLVAGQTLFTSSGLELLIQARSRSPATVRVLMVSAAERRAIEPQLALAELFYILRRPCTSEQLREVLHAAVRTTEVQTGGTTAEHVVLESQRESTPTDAVGSGDPITVLTTDVDLFEAIRAAVRGRHEVHLAAKLEDAARLAAAGQCAVLVTDVALTEAALRRITAHLHAREEALVTIAVGDREQGNALMGLLSTGSIHRFLLKPVTPGLARLALESATRHHASAKAHRRTEASFEPRPLAMHAPAQPEIPTADEVPQPAPSPERTRRIVPIAIAAVVLLGTSGAAAWYFTHRTPAPDRRALAIASNLAAAQTATRDGHLLEPLPGSAYALYSEVLRLDPQNAAARAGIDQLASRFIEQAETELVEGHLDAAATSLTHARQLRPEHRRLKFLDAQLAKERQEQLLLQARQSATAGNLQQAQELLQQAQQVESRSSDVTSAQQIIDSRTREQQVAAWLDLARLRVAQNRLVSPDNDSAKYYLRSAQRLEPDNVAVKQGLRDLGDRVVSSADAAVEAQRLNVARDWVVQAQDLKVDKAQIDRLNARIASSVDLKTRSDLLALAVKRTDENRLLDPPQDSARYYLDRLAQIDPAFRAPTTLPRHSVPSSWHAPRARPRHVNTMSRPAC